MIIRRKKRIFEDAAVQAATVSADTDTQENKEDSSVLDNPMTEEEKKQKALEELDSKDDAEIMTYILSGKMPEDADVRDKIFKRGNDYIQKQMTNTITPDKQKEIYNKILAGAGLSAED